MIARREALIELGMISSSAEVYQFAQNLFVSSDFILRCERAHPSRDSIAMGKDEQQEILDKLDHHTRHNSQHWGDHLAISNYIIYVSFYSYVSWDNVWIAYYICDLGSN